MLEISRVQPAARPIVAAAANVYLRHTDPWFVGLALHGSALKGGYIPSCSDVDFQLYLDPSAFTAEGTLPFPVCAAIQRELALIDPAPFSEIQCYPLACRLPAGQVDPIPGAYVLLAGRLGVSETTPSELRASAAHSLATLRTEPDYVASSLLHHGAGRLGRAVRLLCTDVWPTLYHLLVLRTGDPIAVWNLPKPEAIALLPEHTLAGRAIRAFDVAVRAYYPAQASVDGALVVLENGLAFLHSALESWVERQE